MVVQGRAMRFAQWTARNTETTTMPYLEIHRLTKHTREELIKSAQLEHADEGEAWKDRMDAWLDRRGPNLGQWVPGGFSCFSDPEFISEFVADNPFLLRAE